MRRLMRDYINSRYGIMNKFGCKDDIPIKPMPNAKWSVMENDGIFFLSIFDEKNNQGNFAIAKNDGEPVILNSKDYSMVVAIDCVKIGYIFRDVNRIK